MQTHNLFPVGPNGGVIYRRTGIARSDDRSGYVEGTGSHWRTDIDRRIWFCAMDQMGDAWAVIDDFGSLRKVTTSVPHGW